MLEGRRLQAPLVMAGIIFSLFGGVWYVLCLHVVDSSAWAGVFYGVNCYWQLLSEAVEQQESRKSFQDSTESLVSGFSAVASTAHYAPPPTSGAARQFWHGKPLQVFDGQLKTARRKQCRHV